MYKLSPSDFAFLYEQCKLCYYLKIKHNIRQPSMPMPGVFSAINTRIQTPLVGKMTSAISDDIEEAEIIDQEKFVKSIAIPDTKVYISGKYDLLARKTDGSYMLIDLKISQPHEDKIAKYSTQLSAYKYALENPAGHRGIKVTTMGLLIFYPDEVELRNSVAKVSFPAKWMEIKPDLRGFMKFAKEIDVLLRGDSPKEGKDCKWCAYRHVSEEISHGPTQYDLDF